MIPKVIIDCDPGIDDAMALFMILEAHKRNQIKVLAITTVNGNSNLENVNKNASKIIAASDVQVPIFSGAAQPLVFPFTFTHYPHHGKDGFGDAYHKLIDYCDIKQIIENECASSAIIRLIEENPGEVILTAIGPLTNIALALSTKPSTFAKLKDFYAMGGNLTGVGNYSATGEFNFVFDPEAAKVVLDRMPLQIKLVSWEPCSDPVEAISYDERMNLSGVVTTRSQFLNTIEENSLKIKRTKDYITCDQLAIAWILDEHTKSSPTLVTKSESFFATVEVMGRETRGLVIIDRRKWIKLEKHNILALQCFNKKVYMDYLKMAFV